MRARLLLAVPVLLALELFAWPRPARAGDMPAWMNDATAEDHSYKYYVGRAKDPDETVAFRKAYEDAMEQAIGANFGSTTSISSQSYEDLVQGTHTRRVEVRLPEVVLRDFEQIGYHRDGDTLWVRFRYSRQAIEEERKRLVSASQEAPESLSSSSGASGDKGGVRVTTSPEDVEVFIDDKRWGTTPLLLERKLDPGRHTIRLDHPHYNPVMEQLIVNPGEVQEITKTMSRAKGTLRINTAPIDGAAVIVDGNLVGRTPLDQEVFAGLRVKIRVEHEEAEPMAT
ncbi:MAG TPA: PEGA domain-containing protein, partial [Deltaproteobacteria bacterium]|nr:PEGA domain-containing protein [Deltaproteobacteria bacterium]